MHTWPLQEAKSRFSEVVDSALKEGPQMVTGQGEQAVVIMAANDYHRMSGTTPNLLESLFHAPRGEPLEVGRSHESIRDLAL